MNSNPVSYVDSTTTSVKERIRITTEAPFASEEDEIVTLVIVVIGIIIAMIILFSMGVFLDCRHQDQNSEKRKPFPSKISLPRKKNRSEDSKSLAENMCPTAVHGLETGEARLDVFSRK